MILPTDLPLNGLLGSTASALYALTALLSSRHAVAAATRALWMAWVVHALCWASGLGGLDAAGPHFGFAPALSVTAWLVLAFYVVEQRWVPQISPRWTLGCMGAVVTLLSVSFPGIPLKLNASAWLPLHWALGLASYGLIGAAVVHAIVMTRAESQMRLGAVVGIGMPLLTLERLTFRLVSAGFVLLSATLLAGWGFSELLYEPGKVWRWDHKTILSVLSWLTFAVLLVGRFKLGWRGRTALRVLYAGSGLLLLAYVGSRFVLEVVLERSS